MLDFKNIDKLNIELKKYKKITNIISSIRLFLLISIVVLFIVMLSLMQYLIYGIIVPEIQLYPQIYL